MSQEASSPTSRGRPKRRVLLVMLAPLITLTLGALVVPDLAASQTYQGCDEVPNQSPAERNTCEEEAWITEAERTPTQACQNPDGADIPIYGRGKPLEETWCKQAEAQAKAGEEAAKEAEERQVIAKAEASGTPAHDCTLFGSHAKGNEWYSPMPEGERWSGYALPLFETWCRELAAKEASEQQALKEAEEATVEAKKNAPLKRLKVRARPLLEVPGESGFTDLAIVAAPYANVTVRIARFGHRTEHYELGPGAVINDKVRWSCERPGGVFRYTVSAHTNAGKTLVRKGSFRPLTTAAHCAKAKREREESEREFAAEVKLGEEERQREATQHRREWEANCRAENGTPRTLNTGEGPERYCVAPGGGFLSVPEP